MTRGGRHENHLERLAVCGGLRAGLGCLDWLGGVMAKTHTWHYVYGAVWTTPGGPEDGGQCVAMRASKSDLEPTEKDAALRLMAEAPAMLGLLRRIADYWAGGDVPADLDADMRALLGRVEA